MFALKAINFSISKNKMIAFWSLVSPDDDDGGADEAVMKPNIPR